MQFAPKTGKTNVFSSYAEKWEEREREKSCIPNTQLSILLHVLFYSFVVRTSAFLFFLYFCVLFFSVPNISLFLCFVVLFSYTSLRRFHFFIFLYFTIPAFEREHSHFYPLFLYNFTNYQTYYRASLKWRKSKGKKKEF